MQTVHPCRGGRGCTRQEAGLSQGELARVTYTHRNTINNFEKGKRVPDAQILSMIAHALEKPVAYFFPKPSQPEVKEEELSVAERTLPIHFRRIWKEGNQILAVSQVKAIADVETQLDLKEQDREVLRQLDEKVARGEKLSAFEENHWRGLKDKYG